MTTFLPNFLVIGAARAGTTAIHHALAQHPQIFMSPVKETNYFAFSADAADFAGPGAEFVNNSVRSFADYTHLFAKAAGADAVGEACPLYLYAPEAPRRIAETLGQDPEHELMALFTRALRELGDRITVEYFGRFLGLVNSAEGSAERLAETLATWPTWRDVSHYEGEPVPFYKRAQIAAADLHLAGIAPANDLDRLTLFADNLVPHVLRLDGVLPAFCDVARAMARTAARYGRPSRAWSELLGRGTAGALMNLPDMFAV